MDRCGTSLFVQSAKELPLGPTWMYMIVAKEKYGGKTEKLTTGDRKPDMLLPLEGGCCNNALSWNINLVYIEQG